MCIRDRDITVGARDQVVPSLGSKVKDGDTITVRYARKLVVTVDGVVKEYWTTATTVDAATYATVDLVLGRVIATGGARVDGWLLGASRLTPATGIAPSIGTQRIELTADPRGSVQVQLAELSLIHISEPTRPY